MSRYLDLFRAASGRADSAVSVDSRHAPPDLRPNGAIDTNGKGAHAADPVRSAADDAWAERAAVAEHDGGLARADAEALADACHPPAPTDAPPDDWAAWYWAELQARVTRRRNRPEAERRVYGLALSLWHMHYGARPDGHRCAGCAGPLGAHAWTLPDGARVHDDHRMPGCLASWGGRWRPSAAAALARLGIIAPEGEP